MRALALFSGGLDSMLAIKLIAMQNIEVIALNMDIGFGATKDKRYIFSKRADIAGATFEIVNIRDEYIDKVLFSPKYGYGKGFNPCIDCHAFMLKIAKKLLVKYDAKFIITGEVLGQRPMSQNGKSLQDVLNLSGDEDSIVLRPLSAKLLRPTTPEIKGWVEREKLYDIQGRDRKIQLKLAKGFGFEDFQNPGGGCLLTESLFTEKMKDFIKYSSFDSEDIELLKIGRHFRLPDGAKLIFGRNESENFLLSNIKNSKLEDVILDESLPGPFGKISKNASQNDKEFACKIILSYTKADETKSYIISIANEKITSNFCQNRSMFRQYAVGI